jgi:uncharacterized OsmC-like protein
MSPELKQGVDRFFNRLSQMKDPSESAGKPAAVAKLVGPQTSVAKADGYNLVSDEPESIGGRGTAPSPSALFVASIGFAENVVFARQAALYGLDFDSYETSVEGHWDMKGMFGQDGRESAIQEFIIETKIKTDAPAAKVVELVKLTNERCPMTATVGKAAPVKRKLFINGTEAPL